MIKKNQLVYFYNKKYGTTDKTTLENLIIALNEVNNRNCEPIKYFIFKKEKNEYQKVYEKFLKKIKKENEF